MKILEVKNLKKIYESKGLKTEALTDINFSVEKGEFVAIMGESGSGKSTLLNIVATLDKKTNGSVTIDGKDIGLLKDKDLSAFRRKFLGFVFQDFNLLDTFSNRDNIYLPLVLSGFKEDLMRKALDEIKESLLINDFLDKYPYEISGGQRQRIAIARALITKPSLVLADEPTGALDSKSSEKILELFSQINNKGQTILMVTHSIKAASYASRVLFIKDGLVYHEIYRGEEDSREFMERINDSLMIVTKRGEN